MKLIKHPMILFAAIYTFGLLRAILMAIQGKISLWMLLLAGTFNCFIIAVAIRAFKQSQAKIARKHEQGPN